MKPLILLFLFLALPPELFCQEGSEKQSPLHKKERLDSMLENRGIQLEVGYKGEFWANIRGGIRAGQTHLHEIDLSVTFDTEKAGLWAGGEFFGQFLSHQGGALLSREFVGDIQNVSNIETPHSSRLYQLRYEHSFLSDKLSILLGIHDFNEEFLVNEHGSLFVNSSFGISSDTPQAARPGIFPLATLGVRARYTPYPSWEFLVGVYNGDPGDPAENKHFPGLDFDNRRGALIGIEGAYHYGRTFLAGTVKFGFWKNTGIFFDILNLDSSGNPVEHKGNQGWYLIADKKITAETEQDQGLGVFLQLGWTPDENINMFHAYIGTGLHYSGLIPDRDADEIGIAVARLSAHDNIRISTRRERAETVLEITYRAVLHPKFALQPDLQIVFNPGADSNLNHAVVMGVRLESRF